VRADRSETAELSRARLPCRTGEGAPRPLLPHRRFIKLRQARAGRRGLRPVLARHYGTQAKGAWPGCFGRTHGKRAEGDEARLVVRLAHEGDALRRKHQVAIVHPVVRTAVVALPPAQASRRLPDGSKSRRSSHSD
jgi:hypothetical protein